VGTILLAGSTGVLGPYLLRELSQRSNIKKIFCLIRKTGSASPSERLLKRLQAINLDNQVNMSKVECIQGDVTDDKFGLSEEEYNRLAKCVDAVVNSAVRADHTAKYCKVPEEKKQDARNVNVKGTIRVLEFATHSRLKHVYHASTILTITTADEEGCLSEEWQDVGAFDEFTINTGYILSKHIGEQLCRQATERGIPIKTFRHPFIGGDGRTGRCDYVTNHIILRWLAYMKLGCMPDIPIPLNAMSVDECSDISLQLFFNPRAAPGVYNIMQPDGATEQIIIGVASGYGIDIQPISFPEFVEKLKLESDDSPLAPFKKLYVDEEAAVAQNIEQGGTLQALQKYMEDSTNYFRSRKLPQFIQNYEGLESTEEVMKRDLRYLKELGVFDKFGIKY
jgi:thioester reductase-like protein